MSAFEFRRGETRPASEPLGLHVVGVDLSMQKTGVAVIRPGTTYRRVVRIDSGKTDGEYDKAPYAAILVRLRDITARVRAAAITARQPGDRTLIVLEAPAFSFNAAEQQGRHTMAWLWGRTYEILSREGAVATVPPANLKMYVTGDGTAAKAEMIRLAVHKVFPDVNFVRPGARTPDDNMVDAYGLAAMGCRELGYPVEPSVQRVSPRGLAAVRWPDPRPSITDMRQMQENTP